MDGFVVLDLENCGVQDKPKGERMAKGPTVGTVARKSLVDISNLPQQPKISSQDEKPQPISFSTKEYVDKLHKENMALIKLLADRNKIIEESGIQFQKLRINLQQVQQRNLQLAQANSQMMAELNLGKDRLKALQHELGCKNGVIQARNLELQEKAKMKTVTCQETRNEVGTVKCNEAGESSQADKPCNTNRRRQSKIQVLGPSVKQVEAKEKASNKRLCMRRQSARFKSEDLIPTEDLFEIDDTKFPVCPLHDDSMHENGPTSSASSVKNEEKEGNSDPSFEVQAFRRSSIGRPLRRAAERVQSYKEIPLNVKMRRTT
ncbi:hypothetical protein L1049_012162 [Liquidambar formosana]|uniref:Shugoshin C-terminal domain-containing protein n=1 Tax=Liquidambar formosana TaxID=63359 RepID=A0AAP0RYM3_LIQFO